MNPRHPRHGLAMVPAATAEIFIQVMPSAWGPNRHDWDAKFACRHPADALLRCLLIQASAEVAGHVWLLMANQWMIHRCMVFTVHHMAIARSVREVDE